LELFVKKNRQKRNVIFPESTNNPSPGPRGLVKTPVAGHPLPEGEG
jgi:hypothetical protein